MKKFIALALSLIMILSIAPSVFAASVEDAEDSMSVQYNVSNAYSINIPEVYDMNTDSYAAITAKYVHTEAGKRINVNILTDGEYYQGGGNITLKGCDAGNSGKTIRGYIQIGSTEDSIVQPMSDNCICSFYGDGGEISYEKGPYMNVLPMLGNGVVCGNYSATVFFDVVIDDLN